MNPSISFTDSNIWLYSLMTDPIFGMPEDIRKQSIAATLIRQMRPVIITQVSTQVINETCSVLMRKAKFEEVRIREVVEGFAAICTIVELTTDTLVQASQLRSGYGFSFWDGLIVASALEASASILYSEDMQAGLVVAGRLTIINPFV
jgi:predicted nucleic acid-binding protein